MHESHDGRRGLRLSDLLYVIGIVAIVMAVLFPVVAQARESAGKASYMTGFRAVTLGASMYAQDYDDGEEDHGRAVHETLLHYRANPGHGHGGGGSNGISYHGGPLILGTTNVYYIWYGNWSGNSATTILTDLATNIGGSPYFNINTTYYDSANAHVANSVRYAGSTTDSYSQGTALSDAGVQAVVAGAISSGLPKD